METLSHLYIAGENVNQNYTATQKNSLAISEKKMKHSFTTQPNNCAPGIPEK